MRNTGELDFLLCGVNAAVEISPALAGSLPSAAKKSPGSLTSGALLKSPPSKAPCSTPDPF